TPDTDAVTFHDFQISPDAITFPGQVHLHLNMTFHRVVEHAFIDIEINRMLFGIPIKLPCLDESMVIGSCNNADACHIFNSILRDPNHQTDYGHQAENVFFAAIGHHIQCPIPAENIVVNDGSFTLFAVADFLKLLTSGNYQFKLKAKDSKDGPYNIGCMEVNATVSDSVQPVVG
ncbi:hypothetical protein MAR_007908, partial [Mya arenaria]